MFLTRQQIAFQVSNCFSKILPAKLVAVPSPGHTFNDKGRLPLMRLTMAGLMVFIVLQAAAQNLPNKMFDTQVAVYRPSQTNAFDAANITHKPRIFDRKFLLLAGIATSATILDIATTSHCMSTYGDCQEGNPLLGSHPSPAKLYGVSFSMLGGQLLASAWMRRKMPNGRSWMIPPIIAGTGHGIAAALNFRTMHQLSSSR